MPHNKPDKAATNAPQLAAGKFIFCIIILLISSAFLMQYKRLSVQRVNPQPPSEDITYDEEDIICMLAEKITYEQNNRYYTEQEKQQVINEFRQREKSLDIITDYLKTVGTANIEFQATDYFGKEFHKVMNTIRHLTVIDGKISFLYSDISTYLQVRSNERLVDAIEEISKDMDYAECRNDQIAFALSEEYFADKATIVYQYQETKDKDFYVYGINATEGWIINIYGYQEYVRKYPNNIYGILTVPKLGEIRNWTYFTLESNAWKEADMKKKLTVTVFMLLSLVCLINAFYVSRKVIPEKDEEITGINKSAEFYKTTEIPDLRYSAFMPYYFEQKQEFQNVLEVFNVYKGKFNEILECTKNISNNNEIVSLYLLDEYWKEQLEYLPHSNFLESYEGYFLAFKTDEISDKISIDMKPDEPLLQQVTADEKLKVLLNTIGRSGEVSEIIFCRETVWFKLAGPFFKEKIPAAIGYFYRGKANYPEVDQGEQCDFIEVYREDMWLDEHWLILVPYPASPDENYNPYTEIFYN